jgi:hypothetical protein
VPPLELPGDEKPRHRSEIIKPDRRPNRAEYWEKKKQTKERIERRRRRIKGN